MGTSEDRPPAGTLPLDIMESSVTDPMLGLHINKLVIRLKAHWPAIRNDPDLSALAMEAAQGLQKLSSQASGKALCGPDLWNKAYQLERLVALIQPSGVLASELERVSAQVAESGSPAASRLKQALDERKEILGKFRSDEEYQIRLMLLDGLEELHWTAQRKFSARPLQIRAISRTTFFVFLAATIFILPYLALYVMSVLDKPFNAKAWEWLPLATVLSAGLFGAFFSRLSYLQSNIGTLSLDALAEAEKPSYLLFRGIVGMSGALFVFFFLQSGLISGKLFPTFDDLGIREVHWTPAAKTEETGKETVARTWNIVLPTQSFALLIVWSFLAGFSERLVPNILSSTDKTLTEAAQKGVTSKSG